jgi:hypothetical protein
MKKPPSCSLVSAKGPSVVSAWPSSTRTVVAASIGSSCAPPTTPGDSAIASYSPMIDRCSSSGRRSKPSRASVA